MAALDPQAKFTGSELALIEAAARDIHVSVFANLKLASFYGQLLAVPRWDSMSPFYQEKILTYARVSFARFKGGL